VDEVERPARVDPGFNQDWPAPIEWSGGDVSLGMGAVPA
jgi:hypothetical protein